MPFFGKMDRNSEICEISDLTFEPYVRGLLTSPWMVRPLDYSLSGFWTPQQLPKAVKTQNLFCHVTDGGKDLWKSCQMTDPKISKSDDFFLHSRLGPTFSQFCPHNISGILIGSIPFFLAAWLLEP